MPLIESLYTQSEGIWGKLSQTPKDTIGWFILGLVIIAATVCSVDWWFYYIRNHYGHIKRGIEIVFTNLFAM